MIENFAEVIGELMLQLYNLGPIIFWPALIFVGLNLLMKLAKTYATFQTEADASLRKNREEIYRKSIQSKQSPYVVDTKKQEEDDLFDKHFK